MGWSDNHVYALHDDRIVREKVTKEAEIVQQQPTFSLLLLARQSAGWLSTQNNSLWRNKQHKAKG